VEAAGAAACARTAPGIADQVLLRIGAPPRLGYFVFVAGEKSIGDVGRSESLSRRASEEEA
jgi:hypothetical protein